MWSVILSLNNTHLKPNETRAIIEVPHYYQLQLEKFPKIGNLGNPPSSPNVEHGVLLQGTRWILGASQGRTPSDSFREQQKPS